MYRTLAIMLAVASPTLAEPSPTLEKPDDVFAAVRYKGRWFFIEDTDNESKRAFCLLIYLFQLQAPETSAAAPVLTLPTGP